MFINLVIAITLLVQSVAPTGTTATPLSPQQAVQQDTDLGG